MISSRSAVLSSDRMPVVLVRVAMSDSSDPSRKLLHSPTPYGEGEMPAYGYEPLART